MKTVEAPKSTVYPAFRYRAAKSTDSKEDQKNTSDGIVTKLFNTAEDEQSAEDLEPGHQWFNNPGLKEEKPNATVADIQNDMAAQIESLKSELESVNSVVAIQEKQIQTLKDQIAATASEGDKKPKK